MTLEGRRVLFISYNGMLDPLGQSQVIPYLRELAALGVFFTLLSFERASAFAGDGPSRCEVLRRDLAAQNIEWHWLRYHKKPSVPATAFDVIAGIRYATRLVKRNEIEMVHARSHIPAAIALALKKRFRLKMIFDLRGLMAEEYVEANHWREGGLPYRFTKNLERMALAAADGVVTLTEAVWPVIKEWDGLRDRDLVHQVVPCCADLCLFKFDDDDRVRRRAELGLENSLVMVYCGSLGGWYLGGEMADLFLELLKLHDKAHFLWLTSSPAELATKVMTERRVPVTNFTVLNVPSLHVPSYLCASDFGVAFYKPGFSKQATSPVKVTEYLACGLPVVINQGVGDSAELIRSSGIGHVVQEFSSNEYARATSVIESLLRDQEMTRRRARNMAEEFFNLRTVGAQRYAELYKRVFHRG